MLKQIKLWFSAPVFEGDQEKTWRASLLHAAIVTCLLVVILVVVGNLVGGRTPMAVFIVDGIMLVVLALIRGVLMRGKVSLAGTLVIAFGIGLISLASAGLGTIRTPSTAFLILIIIIAGLSHGKTGLILSVVSSSLAVLGLILAENAGILPRPDMTVTTTQWISYTVAFGLTGMLTNFAYQSMQQALERAFVEMSERKQVEESLRLSEARLKEAERIAQLGHWELDISQNKLHWSDEIYRIFERPSTQTNVSYEDFLNVVHPDDRDVVDKTYAESLESKKPYKIEHRILLEDGRVKYVRELGETFFDAHGKAIRSIGTVQDITEQKRAEDQLRKLSRAVEAAPVSIVITDKYGRIEYANPFFSKITGYLLNDILGKNPKVLQSGLTPSDLYPQLWETILNGKNWEGEFVNKKKNGELYTELALISPVHATDGSITHFVGIKQDITQRRMAEEELKISEEKFAKAFRLSADVITITSVADGLIVEVNDSVKKVFGYTHDEAIGKTVSDLNIWPDPAQREQYITNLRRDGIVRDWEVQMRAKSGKLVDILLSGEIIDLQGDKYILGTLRDITERKRMESELERLATTDPLTGVHNRREFARLAEIELERARRYKHPTSAIMLDADHFKEINDTYGHAAGDRALVVLAQLLNKEVRASDLVARYGGEEFMLLLTETTITSAQGIAERIRRAVADMPVKLDDQTIRFTVSLGVTSSESVGQDLESLLKEADRLLYQAKQSGRNQVVSHG